MGIRFILSSNYFRIESRWPSFFNMFCASQFYGMPLQSLFSLPSSIHRNSAPGWCLDKLIALLVSNCMLSGPGFKEIFSRLFWNPKALSYLYSPGCTQVLLLLIYIFRTCLFTIYDKLCVANRLKITTTSVPYYKTFL
jgi:hypothetical protein